MAEGFRGLIEAAGGKFVFIPAEVMTELVEVGEADFVAKTARVRLGVVPDIFQVEDDVRRLGLIVGEGAAVGVAGEQTEDVVGEAFVEGIGIGQPLVMNRHRTGQRAQSSGQSALGVGNRFDGYAGELIRGHEGAREALPLRPELGGEVEFFETLT